MQDEQSQLPNYEYKPVQYDDLLKEYPAESPFKNEHYLFTGWNGIYQGTFAGFIWMARFLNSKVKYYMASASIPVEILNFFVVLKKVVGREKPLAIFVGIVLPLLALIGTMVLVDLVRYGVIASGPLAAIAGAGPFIFTGALALFGALNTLRAIDTAKECWAAYKNGTLTYLHKVRLASRITKSAALFALSGLIAPFMFATLANPVGAIIFGAVITAVLVTVVVMKIWKTVQENREWEKTLQELNSTNEDPYEALDLDRVNLNRLIEEKNTASGFVKLRNMFKAFWTKAFGSPEEKEALKNKPTPGSYVKECLEEAIKGKSPEEIAKLSRYAELIRKQRGRDMYKDYIWKKTILDLKGQNPYRFLGTSEEEVNAEVAKEEKPGLLIRLLGKVPESEKAKAHLEEKYNAFGGQDKNLAKRVMEMLSEAKGREKYKEYIANQTKNSVPEHTMPIRVVDVEDALNPKAYGNPISSSQRNAGIPGAAVSNRSTLTLV